MTADEDNHRTVTVINPPAGPGPAHPASRKLDAVTGQPPPDTDTDDDWPIRPAATADTPGTPTGDPDDDGDSDTQVEATTPGDPGDPGDGDDKGDEDAAPAGATISAAPCFA